MVSVIELSVSGTPEVERFLYIDPSNSTKLPVDFATADECAIDGKRWMEKFGEWKHIGHAHDWNEKSKASWEVEIMEAGHYQVDLNYSGECRLVWRVENEEGQFVQNQQNSSHVYHYYEMGLLKFSAPGKHTISVELKEGNMESASLREIKLTPLQSLE